ncbi:MAG: oligosaccharide flippase family protein, partial [Steroidobacteraceae bacterium]
MLAGLRSYAALRLFTQVASWLGTVYVVRELDSHAVGQYGVALVVFNYLSMVYDGTCIEALVQRPPATRAERRAAFTLLLGLGLLSAGVVAAVSKPVAQLVGDATVAPLVAVVALALLLTSLCVLPHAALAREMAFSKLATIGAIQAVCVTAASVFLAYLGAGAWALAAGLLVGAAVRCVLLNAAAFGLVPPTLHLSPAVGYLRFGGVLFADNVLWRWYTSLDTLLLGRWAGTT